MRFGQVFRPRDPNYKSIGLIIKGFEGEEREKDKEIEKQKMKRLLSDVSIDGERLAVFNQGFGAIISEEELKSLRDKYGKNITETEHPLYVIGSRT